MNFKSHILVFIRETNEINILIDENRNREIPGHLKYPGINAGPKLNRDPGN